MMALMLHLSLFSLGQILEESTEFKSISNYSGSLCLNPMTYYEKNTASICNLITGKQRPRESSLLEVIADTLQLKAWWTDIFLVSFRLFSLKNGIYKYTNI